MTTTNRAIENMVKPTRQKTKAMTRVRSMEGKNLEGEKLRIRQGKDSLESASEDSGNRKDVINPAAVRLFLIS